MFRKRYFVYYRVLGSYAESPICGIVLKQRTNSYKFYQRFSCEYEGFGPFENIDQAKLFAHKNNIDIYNLPS